MSADALPITPSRFAEALRDLSLASLHLKVLELRNSIAHLDYSNEQLRPFAEGAEPVLGAAGAGAGAAGDPDCADAIRENEAVIARMQARVALVRAEVEARGCSWREFQAKEDEVEETEPAAAAPLTNGHAAADEGERPPSPTPPPPPHAAWTDGTFQAGTIRGGEVRMGGGAPRPPAPGGTLSDEELRRMLEERLATRDDDDDEEGGMHL